MEGVFICPTGCGDVKTDASHRDTRTQKAPGIDLEDA